MVKLKELHIKIIESMVINHMIPFDGFVEGLHYLLFLEDAGVTYVRKKYGLRTDKERVPRPELKKLSKLSQQIIRMYSNSIIVGFTYRLEELPLTALMLTK